MAQSSRPKLTHDDLSALDEVPEVKQLVAPLVATPESLSAIAQALAERKREAKEGRTATELESIWQAAEDAYNGIDDANRGEVHASGWTKSPSIGGPITANSEPGKGEQRSTVFIPVTARYVDAGAAKAAELLLPPDDKIFSFEPLPEPELIAAKEDQSQVVHDGMGNVPLTRPARADEVARMQRMANVVPFQRPLSKLPAVLQNSTALQQYMPPQQPPANMAPPTMGEIVAGQAPSGAEAATAPRVPLTVADFANENIEIARKYAKAAETRIEDWLKDCHAAAEIRKVIQDSSKLGVGVLKGPFPEIKRAVVSRKTPDGGRDIIIEEKIKPVVKWISPWNFFPDPACGEDIHKGGYCFERDYQTEKQVRDLKELPGYIGSAIDQAIEQGPVSNSGAGDQSPSDRDKAKDKHRYEIWYYYGTLKRSEYAQLADAAGDPMDPDDAAAEEIDFVIVTMIGDCVVKATINPLNSGSFPYDAMPWRRRAGSWAGIGVAEAVRTPQRIVNAAERAAMNNAALSAGPQVVIDKRMIEPADGQNWSMTPNKPWVLKQGSAVNPGGVKDAFGIFEIPNQTEWLLAVKNDAMQMAEECTSIPLITEGKANNDSPDTYGATALLNTNANQLLRAVAYAFDEMVTEPLARRYYEWLLTDDDVPDEEKGQFRIDAHGSRFVERAISDQAIIGMQPMAQIPEYRIDPVRYTKIRCRAARIHPDDLMFSDEEWQRISSAPPPDAPAVAAAKIRSASQSEGNANDLQVKREEIHANVVVDVHKLALERELAMLQYANREKVNLDTVKSQLAKTAMQLSTERELNSENNQHDFRKHTTPSADRPPVQAPGRAAPGHQFDQKNP